MTHLRDLRPSLRTIPIATIALGLFSASGALAQTTGKDAIDVSVQRNAVTVAGRGAMRAQSARLASTFKGTSFAKSLSAKPAFELAAFDDLTFNVQRLRVIERAGGAITWRGTIKNRPGSQALFVANEKTFAGNIQLGERSYQVRGTPEGNVITTEIDTSMLPLEAEPLFKGAASYVESLCKPKAGTVAPATKNVDILVAYTAASEVDLPAGSTMATEIELAVEDANAAYEASGIQLHLTLVGPAQRYVYTETDFFTDVDRLTKTADGHLDGIHALRDEHSADLAVLMVHNGTYCGIASAIQDTISTEFASSGFALVNLGCATSNHSFAHELGHLMGAHHDTGVDTTGASYAHGFIDMTHSFRTVMSYKNACVAQNKTCPRVGVFSGPAVRYQGYVAGSATKDNVRRLNETAWTVSRFRLNAQDAQYVNTSTLPNICTIAKKPPATLQKPDIAGPIQIPAAVAPAPAQGVRAIQQR